MENKEEKLDELRTFVHSKPKSYTNLLRTDRYSSMLKFIHENKPLKMKSDELNQIIYWLINGMDDYYKCPECGKDITLFKSLFRGYAKHCSAECAHIDKRKLIEYYKTVDHSEIKRRYEKAVQSNQNRSDEEKRKSLEKSRKTRFERYGNSSYNNIDNARKTNIARYGVEYPAQLEENKTRTKKTRASMYYDKTFLNNEYLEPLFSKEEYIEQCLLNDNLTHLFKWKCLKCGTVLNLL